MSVGLMLKRSYRKDCNSLWLICSRTCKCTQTCANYFIVLVKWKRRVWICSIIVVKWKKKVWSYSFIVVKNLSCKVMFWHQETVLLLTEKEEIRTQWEGKIGTWWEGENAVQKQRRDGLSMEQHRSLCVCGSSEVTRILMKESVRRFQRRRRRRWSATSRCGRTPGRRTPWSSTQTTWTPLPSSTRRPSAESCRPVRVSMVTNCPPR